MLASQPRQGQKLLHPGVEGGEWLLLGVSSSFDDGNETPSWKKLPVLLWLGDAGSHLEQENGSSSP